MMDKWEIKENLEQVKGKTSHKEKESNRVVMRMA